MTPEYLYLSEAVSKNGLSESYLIRLGIAGHLKFYIHPKNWVYTKYGSCKVSVHVDEPVYLNPDYLKELSTGRECVMYFSDEFPDYVLEDLDDEPIQDNGADYVSAPFGWKIEIERLMIFAADLEQLNKSEALSLFKAPSRQDGWFEVINDAATNFYKEFGKLPNEYQLWGQLNTNPPRGYVITSGKDKGEDCLNMPGEKPLARKAFSKRWCNYTSTTSQ